jgi:nuclear pore complex protein Nup155
MYDIPDKIFEQYNLAQVNTMMGLLAEFNHAWVAIDNALYLWDYTHPSPSLIGFEEQPNTITAVRLVVPRAGVFLPQIVRLLVVATTTDIYLVGFSAQAGSSGGQEVALYSTRLSLFIKGIDVNIIEGSAASGRIFFSGRGSDDVYEVTYQQEEKWFQNRCAKVNHTSKGLSMFAPSFSFGSRAPPDYLKQMVVDDSRNLLYTLSARSTIRTFHIKSNGGLDLVIVKPLSQTLNNIGHMTSQSNLISPNMTLVSINPISSQEASRLHLMTTTSTGCRVFMSATSSYGWSNTDSSNAPSSMQVQHVKFPPPEPPSSDSAGQQALASRKRRGSPPSINTSSKALSPTRTAVRYPPGYFFALVSKDPQGVTDTLFVSGPDSGRIAYPQDSARSSRYAELGIWFNLGSRAEDIGPASTPFFAASSPAGFGNELAVQYDKAASEVAILTNTGVHTLRRRRLVDMFAAAIRLSGGDEGLEGEVNKFIRQYGRGETVSTALAVACGQGLDVTPDARVARITDPDILEHARRAFIDFGGKPTFNENSVVDQSLPAIDMVRPSPRHEGLSLLLTRLVRSIWKAPVAKESVSTTGGLAVAPAVSLSKLRNIQEDLTKVKDFLERNRSFIEGLAGPDALGEVSTKQEEVSLQAEHRALHSLQVLINNMIEGISFVLVLFDERIEEIIMKLSNDTRQQLRSLTFEGLFSTVKDKELAKELVKAIVNRNIAKGSNVEQVAEALRRRCGSFCSADDVIIFKAQEQLKRASEAGRDSELGRNLLNESLRLFKQVAANLSMEQLQWAVEQFVQLQFFAGAIQLSLEMAKESDRGNRALSWIQEGRPEPVCILATGSGQWLTVAGSSLIGISFTKKLL